MKIYQEKSLEDFEFWSGACDLASELTSEQFETLGAVLEDLYPDGISDTHLNDLFWFEPEWVCQMAGVYPKYYKLTAQCGRVKYFIANSVDDKDLIENSNIDYEEIEEEDCGYDTIEFDDEKELISFGKTHYFRVLSRHLQHRMIIYCQGDDEAESLKEQFSMCSIEEIDEVDEDGVNGEENWEDWDGDYSCIDNFAYDEDEMYDSYSIPIYAVGLICDLTHGPNNGCNDGSYIPQSAAIDAQSSTEELDEHHVLKIQKFVDGLKEDMPNGFTIDWDVESVYSPYFTQYPAFGAPTTCVRLRVYPNETDTRGNN